MALRNPRSERFGWASIGSTLNDALAALLKKAGETVEECFDALRSNASSRDRKNAWERASALLARLDQEGRDPLD